jgi:Spy/CpxP family protein refolding chaperone
MTEPNSDVPTQSAASSNRKRRWTVLGLGVAALATVGALTAHRHAGAMGFGGHGLGHGPGGWHDGMGGMVDTDPAVAAKRIDARVAYMLAEIDATPEQRERISTILKGLANDMQQNRQRHMQARRQSLELLAAPTIDRAQLEKLRVEQMQLGDVTSRRMLQAMMDSAEVLNPEQRAKLIERWQRRMPPRK